MNNGWRLPKERLSALRLEDIQQYLTGRGWKKEPAAGGETAVVYQYPSLSDAEIVVPRRREFADYAQRMADIVQMLAAVEGRSAWELLHDLTLPPGDVLRLQVISPGASLGNLPLNEGLRLLDGGRSMLLAAACSVLRPQAYHPRQSFKEALDFVDSCRLGQTETGSFVATILAPVPPEIARQPNLFGSDDVRAQAEPFARRATLCLMTALGNVSKAIETGAPDEMLANVETGVSANLCEAVAGMKLEGDQSRLDVRINWSAARPRIPQHVPLKVSLAQPAFSIIGEVGRHLREEGVSRHQQVQGHVVSLRGETTLLDGFEGTVIIKGPIAGGTARIQVTLSRRDYDQACNAHRDGRAVAVYGELHREPKLFHLSHPRDFKVLAESENTAAMP